VAPADLDAFRAAIEGFHPIGFRAMANASAEDLRDALRVVGVPTLILCGARGARDERAPLAVAHHLHVAIDGSRLVVLEGAGHVCNVELPQRFNAEVRAFLAAHDRSR
jgi:pimeloyl-ACP methyl ester carboxylesterase